MNSLEQMKQRPIQYTPKIDYYGTLIDEEKINLAQERIHSMTAITISGMFFCAMVVIMFFVHNRDPQIEIGILKIRQAEIELQTTKLRTMETEQRKAGWMKW